MIVSESYIDRCVAATDSIDIEELSQLPIDREISRGNLFSMRCLGELGVLGERLHCGLKIPNQGGDLASLRLQQELTAVDLLLSHMPEHAAKVPKFMALMAIEGHAIPIAILTEDATQGRKLPIMGLGSLMGRSERARAISKAFKRVDNTRVDGSAIDHSLAFMVGEEERFLDFTPPPVMRTGSFNDDASADRIHDLVYDGNLTLTVSEESPLGRLLATANA